MHAQKKEALLEKGWTKKEIKEAEAILERRELQDLYFSQITFWSVLVVTIFANLLVSLILIPFLIFLKEIFIYVIVIILAVTVGFLYNFLILDIGYLEKKHHLWAGIIVPLFALVNIFIAVLVSNEFMVNLKINRPSHNPWLMALLFIVVFFLPYLIDRLRGKHLFLETSN